jgi:hypothetical protein
MDVGGIEVKVTKENYHARPVQKRDVRRRISRRHRSDLLLLPAKELSAEGRDVGGPEV